MEYLQSNFVFFEDAPISEQIERWEQCARVLADMPEHQRTKHWSMTTFGMRTSCGTIACAAGHCGLDPWFRAQGFQLNFVRCHCGDEGCTITQLNVPEDFFGSRGAQRIFANPLQRPVEAVLEEVRDYIDKLRAGRDVPTVHAPSAPHERI